MSSTDTLPDLGTIITNNPGYLSFMRDPVQELVREAPNVVILGGGRCSGKTAIQTAITEVTKSRLHRAVLHQVHSHASRDMRPYERMIPKAFSHEFRKLEKMETALRSGKFYLAYKLAGNLYGFPIPDKSIRRKIFSPLEEKVDYLILREPSSRFPIPLYLVSTTSPLVYDELGRIFRNGVRVVIGLDDQSEFQLESRIRKRIRNQLTMESKSNCRRITNLEFEALVEKENTIALQTNVAFRHVMPNANLGLWTPDPIGSIAEPELRNQVVQRQSRYNALRILTYLEHHVILFQQRSEVPQSAKVYSRDMDARLNLLFGHNVEKLRTEVPFNAGFLTAHDRLTAALRRYGVDYGWFRSTYTMPMVIAGTPEGSVEVCFKYMGQIPHEELNDMERTFLLILGDIAGRDYKETRDKKGVQFCLSDLTSRGLTIRYRARLSRAETPREEIVVSNGYGASKRNGTIEARVVGGRSSLEYGI